MGGAIQDIWWSAVCWLGSPFRWWGLGNAVLFSIGAAFRARGSRVLYFAGYSSCKTATRSRTSSTPPIVSCGV
jgi:hypothetical protein